MSSTAVPGTFEFENPPEIPIISLRDILTCFHVNGCEGEPLSVRKPLRRRVKAVGV